MGQVIQIPDISLDYALYGDNRGTISSYLQHQIQTLPEIFIQQSSSLAKKLYEGFNYIRDAAHETALRALDALNIKVAQRNIYAHDSFDALQKASPVMQRWIMANPNVRDLYMNNYCDGYSDSYVDVDPGNIGVRHYDYRRVMDSVAIDTDDGFMVQYFHEDIHPLDKELTQREKYDILKTWGASDWLIKNTKLDFTNPTAKVKRAK